MHFFFHDHVPSVNENERPRGKPRGITERNPQEHAQQAPLSSYKAVVESGASCGVFLIPQKRDKPATLNPSGIFSYTFERHLLTGGGRHQCLWAGFPAINTIGRSLPGRIHRPGCLTLGHLGGTRGG